jgi:uncharacterized protein (DUF302 family)
MESWTHRLAATAVVLMVPQIGFSGDTGLITKQSKHSVPVTIQRFEAAVNAKSANGWMVFTELDHAAAAEKYGLKLRPLTVIVFGNPKVGTPSMEKAPTLGIDVPLKALVWEDDQAKVWLTYNSSEYVQSYVYPRHGLSSNLDSVKASAVYSLISLSKPQSSIEISSPPTLSRESSVPGYDTFLHVSASRRTGLFLSRGLLALLTA